MHRSGTSLTASWLNSCGLNIGSNISGKGTGNIKGHFEDNDFLHFHEEILADNNLNYLTAINSEVNILDQHQLKARSIIDYKNKLNSQWGWKEPRTCLFLSSIYKEIIPNAKHLIIFRPFQDVVDSLYRRDLKILKNKIVFPRGYNELFKFKKQKKQLANLYLETWIRYNQDILDYISSINKEDYLFISNEKLIESNLEIFNHLTEKWKFDLSYSNINEIFESSLFQKDTLDYNLNNELVSLAEELQEKLKRYL